MRRGLSSDWLRQACEKLVTLLSEGRRQAGGGVVGGQAGCPNPMLLCVTGGAIILSEARPRGSHPSDYEAGVGRQ